MSCYQYINSVKTAIDIKTLKKGDIIRVNSDGLASNAIQLILSPHAENDYKGLNTPVYNAGAQSGYTQEFRCVYGRAYSKKDNTITMCYEEDLSALDTKNDMFEYLEVMCTDNAKVMVYNRTENEIYESNASAIRDYINSGATDCNIVAQQRYGTLANIIIINE